MAMAMAIFSILIPRIQTISMGEYIPACLLLVLSNYISLCLFCDSKRKERKKKITCYSACFLNLFVFEMYSIVAPIALLSPSRIATFILPTPTFLRISCRSSQNPGHSTRKCSTVSFSYPHTSHSALSTFLNL